MSESQPKTLTAAASLLPLVILVGIDAFAAYLNQQLQSHFIFAMFIAQLLCALVFGKGEICPGQRGRLVKANLYTLIFWVSWLVWAGLKGNVLLGITALLGIAALYCLVQQAVSESLRKALLLATCGFAGAGSLIYLTQLFSIPSMLQYQPAAQALVGVIFTALALNISRNRLQGFIALLPLLMVLCLAINAMLSSVLIFIAQSSEIVFHNEFALLLYFSLHLIIATILFTHVFKGWKLGYQTLIFLLFLASSLPIWMEFVFILE